MKTEIDELIIFQEKCWTYKIPDHAEFKHLINQIIMVEENKNLHNMSHEATDQCNVYAWRSDWETHTTYPVMSNLTNLFVEILNKIAKQQKLKPTGFPDGGVWQCNNCWINKYQEGDHAIPHKHDQHGMSSVYFVQAPPEGGKFILYNPRGTFHPSDDPYSAPYVEIKVEEGTVLFFNGYLIHEATPHKGTEERITIANNYKLGFPVRKEK